MSVPITVLPVEDREAWTETALRAWEADINEQGWGRLPLFSLLMRLPEGAGLGVAQIDIAAHLMREPDLMFSVLAVKPVRYLLEFFGSRWWAGMVPVAGVLCAEARGPVAPQSLNLGIFPGHPTGRREDMPVWTHVRRVMLVAPREENDATLLRRKGSMAPELTQGVPPEGVSGDHSTRDLIREVVRKLVPPDLR